MSDASTTGAFGTDTDLDFIVEEHPSLPKAPVVQARPSLKATPIVSVSVHVPFILSIVSKCF